ncbi:MULTISPECIES: Panacea domain-containing protein [unclassified Frankia]|uniref:Panacea domain-containing protein n=1 Tax=unclassified Frankia TaxID=2632575 RepID=UPI001EF626D9|nr:MULTISPECIES: type II toxin-antitoxin system antitoxin SocA domain-containing protein [unclassified Frankia]
MPIPARDVAAILRARLPGLGAKKLHKLLYYCQGHHLAAFDEPLFSEAISAWDMGPVVAELWRDEKYGTARPPGRVDAGGEAELNTIGYVLSRYGALTGHDLEILSHGELPWYTANQGRRPGDSAPITVQSMREYFATAGAPATAEDEPVLDSAAVAGWLAGAAERRGPGRPDDLNELHARLGQSG